MSTDPNTPRRVLFACFGLGVVVLLTALFVWFGRGTPPTEEPKPDRDPFFLSDEEYAALKVFEKVGPVTFTAVSAEVHEADGVLEPEAWQPAPAEWTPSPVWWGTPWIPAVLEPPPQFKASCVAQGKVVVLREDGAVARVDSLRLSDRLRLPDSLKAQCIGAGPEELLVGLEDGQVLTVSATGESRRVGTVKGRPLMVCAAALPDGRPGTCVLALVEKNEFDRTLTIYRLSNDGVGSLQTSLNLLRFKSLFEWNPTAFLLDSNERLWLGVDAGEWSGRVAVFDFRRLTIHENTSIDAVKGFTELSDGHVMAFGGVSHLGAHWTSVARVDRLSVEDLQSSIHSTEEVPVYPVRPLKPVVQIVSTLEGAVVFTSDSVFRTRDFKEWDLFTARESTLREFGPQDWFSSTTVGVHAEPSGSGALIVVKRAGIERVSVSFD